MRARTPLYAAIAAMILAGCAAATPGYVPDTGRLKLAEAAAKARSDTTGTMDAQGAYIPTAAERAYSCRRLNGILQLKIQQVRDSEANPPSGLVTTMTSKSAPRHTASGGTGAAYSEDRARLIALNNLMMEKKCGHYDLEAALKPGNTATPEAIGAQAGKSGKKKPRL